MKSWGIGVAVVGLVAGLALASGVALGQEDVRAGVRKYINDQMDGMRLQVQSRYATPGMQRLPIKTETGDGFLLPMLLIGELSASEAKDGCCDAIQVLLQGSYGRVFAPGREPLRTRGSGFG